MSDFQTMSHERWGLCWCGPNNHPVHEHEEWQIRTDDNGRRYCSACGDRLQTVGQ